MTDTIHWEKNQIDYKPNGNATTIWRYSYFPDWAEPDERARLKVNQLNGRYVTQAWERMSFVARPRSKAVGAVDAGLGNLPAGAIMENVNLADAPYSLDDRREDHSGQFERNFHEVRDLYNKFMEIIQPE